MPARVLVIDDSVDTTDSLRDLLELSGHVVDVAYNGPDGLTAANLHRPDVVICDLGLPGMDGYAVAAELCRALAPRPGLIAVSGYGRDQDRRRARDAGFDLHLTKPIDFDQLERALAAETWRERAAPVNP